MYNHILSSRLIGVFTHINPDGDALGSSLGLAGYLEQIGKDYFIFLPSEPGEALSFMIPAEIRHKIMVWGTDSPEEIVSRVKSCDLMICLDFNQPSRSGEFSQQIIDSAATKILVDHHVGPDTEHFNLIYSKPEASSTCELLYSLLMDMPDINSDASKLSTLTRESLLTGMTTDTNNFANSTNPQTFIMASRLIEAGTDRDKILDKLYFSYPLRRIKAQAYIMDKLLKITDEGVAYIIVDRRTRKKLGLQEGDSEGFVNVPLSIAQVRMSIMLRVEPDSQKVRVSIRSKKGISARNMAMQYFNGGGHEQASGGRLTIGKEIRSQKELATYVENCIHTFFKEQ